MKMELTQEVKEKRKANYNIYPLILNRWSPRAMSGEELTDDELMQLFEAARWAPSSYNGQPWRFIYAKRNTADWEKFFNLLIDWNKQWCKNAAALVVIISRKTFEHNNNQLSHTYAFDTGAAWENLCLEGSGRGLVVHGMEGFDYEAARKELEIPDDYEVLAMAAIGKRGKKEDLPQQMQEREFPSDRKQLSEIVMQGKFKTN